MNRCERAGSPAEGTGAIRDIASVSFAVALLCISLACCSGCDAGRDKGMTQPPPFLQVLLYDGGKVALNQQIPVDERLADIFRQWEADDVGWRGSYVTYAPHLLVRVGDERPYTINLARDRVIVNRHGKQVVRPLTDHDLEFKQAILEKLTDD